MRVAMYYSNRDVRLEELPRPKVGPGELLMKVMACGICGSDLLEWYRLKTAPRVLGHEATGLVEEVGKGVTRYKIGDRIFVSHHVPCGECRYCLSGHHTACETLHTTNYYPGGFSEFILVPKINVERGVYLLPSGMSFEVGTFVEPLACALRGQRIAGVREGDSVLVLGSGVAGLLHVQLARLRRAGLIVATDLSEYRLRAARRFGADEAIHANEDVPNRIKELNDGRPADKVIVCAGARAAAEQALRSVDRGGTILFFAVPPPGQEVALPLVDFWRNEITIRTSYGAAPNDLEEALALLTRRELDVESMITHRFGLSESQRAFELAVSGEECLKVIIEPQR
ncbi:MAG: zinc-dependent dehydrogenase [Candidatus Hadarchaeales archaeon]